MKPHPEDKQKKVYPRSPLLKEGSEKNAVHHPHHVVPPISMESREVSRIQSSTGYEPGLKGNLREPSALSHNPYADNPSLQLPRPLNGSSQRSPDELPSAAFSVGERKNAFRKKQRMPQFWTSTISYFRGAGGSSKTIRSHLQGEGVENLPVQESEQKGKNQLDLKGYQVNDDPKPNLCLAVIAFMIVFLAVVIPLSVVVSSFSDDELNLNSCGSSERDNQLRAALRENIIINGGTELTVGTDFFLDCLPPRAFEGFDDSEISEINLERLGLTFVCQNAFDGVNFQNLKTISLGGNGLQNLSPGVFSNFPDLESIDLRDNGFQTFNDVEVLSGLSSLAKLSLEGNRGLIEFPKAITSTPSLVTLDLSSCRSIAKATENIYQDFGVNLEVLMSLQAAILKDGTNLGQMGTFLGGVTVTNSGP